MTDLIYFFYVDIYDWHYNSIFFLIQNVLSNIHCAINKLKQAFSIKTKKIVFNMNSVRKFSYFLLFLILIQNIFSILKLCKKILLCIFDSDLVW